MPVDAQRPPGSRSSCTPSLRDCQNDWRLLDDLDLAALNSVRLVSHEPFSPTPGASVDLIEPSTLVRMFRFSNILFNFLYALQLLHSCGRDGVMLLNGGDNLHLLVGLLNQAPVLGQRKIVCWDVFVECGEGWRHRLMMSVYRGFSLLVVWSRSQVKTHASHLRLPSNRIIFLPYKANHSKASHYDLPIGRFVFAGGNGKRDYTCLIDAVRDTGVPVIISATDPRVRKSIERLPNVVVLAASEPDFAKLQAAAEFTVVPMVHTGLKGGGEANLCNGMWHGKPVIAADSIAASDYVVHGETGFVVPSGDAARLRECILELWNDPGKVVEMGQRARQHAEQWFTHKKFIHRLLAVATLVGGVQADRRDTHCEDPE